MHRADPSMKARWQKTCRTVRNITSSTTGTGADRLYDLGSIFAHRRNGWSHFPATKRHVRTELQREVWGTGITDNSYVSEDWGIPYLIIFSRAILYQCIWNWDPSFSESWLSIISCFEGCPDIFLWFSLDQVESYLCMVQHWYQRNSAIVLFLV